MSVSPAEAVSNARGLQILWLKNNKLIKKKKSLSACVCVCQRHEWFAAQLTWKQVRPKIPQPGGDTSHTMARQTSVANNAIEAKESLSAI